VSYTIDGYIELDDPPAGLVAGVDVETMGALPWNRGLHPLLWTPTPGQDMTRSLFPLTPLVKRPREPKP
jgi:hypothetical protein